MITYEQMLASQTELAHFNKNHDPRNGQFAKGHGGVSGKTNTSGDDNTRKSFMTDIAEVSTDKKKTTKRVKKALVAGAIIGTGSLLVTGALAKAGNSVLDEAGIPIKIRPSALAIGKKMLATTLAAYSGATLSDAWRNKKRREYKEKKKRGNAS